ncbi:peptidase M16 [Spirochaetia bacterium]|nr:peptidase M16 [Spirochaetia bacterium]
MQLCKKPYPLLRIVRVALSLTLITAIISCAGTGKPANDAALYNGLGAPTDPVPFTAEARTGTLPGGLKYYILENTMPEGRAYLTLAVNAGSVLEKDDEQGLAHFVEHMAFNGTEHFPKSDLVEYLRSLGMRWGPEVNAYTSFDQTVYGIEVPVESDGEGRKGIPDKALAVIDDWTRAITFAPEDVDSERGVVVEEYRTRLGAGDRLSRKVLPLIYRGSPYAERLPIGLPEIIETAPVERLVNFYRTWYRADNMALVFVGDFDGAKLEADLASHFSLPAPDTPTVRPVYDLPEPQKGNFTVEIFTDPELPHTRFDLYYKLPAARSAKDLASYRQGIIDLLIDRMLGFRFEEAGFNPDTPFAAAGAGLNYVARNSRYYMLIAVAKPGNAEASLTRLLQEKEKMARYGFTGAEIDRVKRSLLADMERAVSEKDRRHSSGHVNDFVAHFIRGEPVTDAEWDLEAVSKLLPDISAAEIAAAAKNYFAYNDLTLIVSAPESEAASFGEAKLPTPDRIRTLVRQSARARIPRPKNQTLDDKFLDAPPAPGSIINKSTDTASGTTHWELSNGAKVILKETKNKNNEIVLYALAKGGITAVPEEQIISANLAAAMLSASGIGPYSRADLMKKLADKQVSIDCSLSSFSRDFDGSATRGDLRTLFELLYLYFTQPRIDDDAAASVLDEYRTTLAQQDQNPEAVYFHEITRTIFNDNPWFRPMVLSDLEKVNTAWAMALIQKALNPADYTFVFTGNLDMDAMRALIETYLASIPPRSERWNTWADIKIERPGKLEKTVYKGKEEKSWAFMSWTLPQEYTESRDVAADVLSEYLENRLMEITRKQMGGTYSVSVGVSQSILPPGGELTMNIYFPCAPNRVTELSAAVLEELDLIAKGTIDQDTFRKSVEALKKSFAASIQNNAYISRSYAYFDVIYDRPLSRLEKLPELYEAVTTRDIQQTVAALLPRGPITVTLYPETHRK